MLTGHDSGALVMDRLCHGARDKMRLLGAVNMGLRHERSSLQPVCWVPCWNRGLAEWNGFWRRYRSPFKEKSYLWMKPPAPINRLY